MSLGWWELSFRLYCSGFRAARVVDFPAICAAEGLAMHHSWQVLAYVDDTQGPIVLDRLPAYAQELNPEESIWGHLWYHARASFCARDLLLEPGRAASVAAQPATPALVRAFWPRAELSLRPVLTQ